MKINKRQWVKFESDFKLKYLIKFIQMNLLITEMFDLACLDYGIK